MDLTHLPPFCPNYLPIPRPRPGREHRRFPDEPLRVDFPLAFDLLLLPLLGLLLEDGVGEDDDVVAFLYGHEKGQGVSGFLPLGTSRWRRFQAQPLKGTRILEGENIPNTLTY